MSLLIVIYGLIIFFANQMHPLSAGRWQLSTLAVVGATISVTLLELLLNSPMSLMDTPQAIILLPLAAAALTLAICAALFKRVRFAVQRVIGGAGIYHADVPMHTIALVMSLCFLAYTLLAFLVNGGLEGVRSAITADPQDAQLSMLFQMFLFLSAAFLGVGVPVRRTPDEALVRLGLRFPTRRDLISGISLGIGLFLMAVAYAFLWERLFTPEQIAQQTSASEALTQTFATVPLALMLAGCAALGEEVLLRGALQPVFGNLLTSAFFALMHTQYLITLGLLLLFGVSLGFGWLRSKQSTTAALIAHFVYNFIPLLFVALAAAGAG